MRSAGRDDGAAAVWAVALTALLLVGVLVVALVSDLLGARARAAAAADLAALAAAPFAASVDLACGQADGVARANGADLVACTSDGSEVEVVARVAIPEPWRRWVALLADSGGPAVAARAGLR